MAYTKTSWVDGITPLSALKMNNLEKQYDEVRSELAEAGTSDIKVHAKNINNAGDGSGLDADMYGGLRWVKPGNTVLLESLSEVTSNIPYFVTKKAFYLVRPGKYRITGDIKSGNIAYTVGVKIFLPVLTTSGVLANAITNVYTTINTDYASFSLDFNIPVFMSRIDVAVDSGDSSNSVYIKNVRIKYADGVPSTLTASELSV